MKRILVGLGMVACVAGVAWTLLAARHVERTSPTHFVGSLPIGGLTRDEAAFKLRQWWEEEKRRPLRLTIDGKNVVQMTRSQLGLRLDDEATVNRLAFRDFAGTLTASLGRGSNETVRIDPVIVSASTDLAKLSKEVEARTGKGSPARATYRNGKVETVPEQPGKTLDGVQLAATAVSALLSDSESVEIPLKEASRRVTDTDLAPIQNVVAEFATSFSTAKASRCSNIKLASSKFAGSILLPGDKLSFNETVGRRSVASGFKIAGVYRNGRHDFDIGGGICQVSSTLYNAALLANLKIVRRANHSMPVPYVPIGRDATVDYGVIDLVIQNNRAEAIAIVPEYKPGRLTFRVLGLGKADVKIVAEGHTSWSVGSETVLDPTLAPGKTKIIEKGSAGHAVTTYRVTYLGGKETGRQKLGNSHYRGGKRIIAVGPQPPIVVPVPTEPR